MNRPGLQLAINGLLRAGRRGVGLEQLDAYIDRHAGIPFSSVHDMATAGKGAGVAVEDLNISTVEAGRENVDRDPIRDVVAEVFETD